MSEEYSANEARDIQSVRPFKNTAREYWRNGWKPFPLPPKKKMKPPNGVTGHHPNRPVTVEQIDEWLDEEQFERGNIGLKLSSVIVEVREDVPDGEYIVLGIDVDNYDDWVIDPSTKEKKLKRKEGGEQLQELSERLGPLPDTWISSARADGVSGIRFFLAPLGLSWKGKAAEHIDVIQPGHRFAVVWPSWHPEGGQYLFTQPGQLPDGTLPTWVGYRASAAVLRAGANPRNGRAVIWNEEPIRIPRADSFPLLPEKWIDELTRNRMPEQDRPLDMDISVDDLDLWAKATFARGGPAGGCRETRDRLEYWLKRVADDPSSHDKVLSAHWQLSRMGILEGHSGCLSAIRSFERRWTEGVVRSGKRGLLDAKEEMFRSRSLAWRKIKREIDEAALEGARLESRSCVCFEEEEVGSIGTAADGRNGTNVGGSSGTLSRDADAQAGAGSDRGTPGSNGRSSGTNEVLATVPSDGVVAGTGIGGSISPVPSGKAKDPGEYARTDDGNAEHLIDLFGEDLKWVPGYGQWIYWNGDRWIQDADGLARRSWRKVRDRQERYARHLVSRARDLEASSGGDDPQVKQLKAKAKVWREWAERSGNNVRATAALEAANSFPGICVQAEQLDGNIRLLGVENGLIELLDTGIHFRQARQEDYVLTNTGTVYRSLASQLSAGGESRKGVELWRNYLELFLPDKELRAFVQKVLGYCLLGRNTERLGVFLYGDTSTGKSTILNAVVEALGEYASTVEMSIFKDKDLNPGLAQAMPRRIITTTEAGAQNFLHADTFKRMTGGDAMSAELKGVNTIIRRIPAFVPVIATNSPPNIRGADLALQRRLCILPFNTQVTEAEDRKTGSAELAIYAREAVLAWLIDGWIMYAKNGLAASKWPQSVLSATREFSHGLNDLGEFLADYCVESAELEQIEPGLASKSYVIVQEMYDKYYQWAVNVQRVPEKDVYTKSRFGKRMAEQGYANKVKWVDGSSVRVYPRIKLKESSENVKWKPRNSG